MTDKVCEAGSDVDVDVMWSTPDAPAQSTTSSPIATSNASRLASLDNPAFDDLVCSPDQLQSIQPPDTAPPAPNASYGPVGMTYQFEGVTFAANPEYLVPVLENYVAEHGESGLRSLCLRLRTSINTVDDDIDSDDEDFKLDTIASDSTSSVQNLAKLARTVLKTSTAIFEKDQVWLGEFKARAIKSALEMLEQSEQRVNEERIRYGIRWRTEQTGTKTKTMRGDSWDYPVYTTFYSMNDSASSRQLAIAAKGLLKRRESYSEAQGKIWELTHQGYSQGAYADPDMTAYEHWDAEAGRRGRDLHVYQTQMEQMFPILAAYTTGGDFDVDAPGLKKLMELANGTTPALAEWLAKEIQGHLENIAKIRADLEGQQRGESGDVNVWRVPKIIEEARIATGAGAGTFHGRLVTDKVEDEKPGFWSKILIGLVQLGLVLLAPFTEGLTLIPAAAISAHQAYTDWKEYKTGKALHGTDFGALALSSEDPSLFWLAVDIIGAGLDVAAAGGAAAKVFRALAPEARAIRSVKATEEEIEALVKHAEELGGRELAELVAQDANKIRALEAEGAGINAAERQAMAAAGDPIRAEVAAATEAAESIAGRSVKVTQHGVFTADGGSSLREYYAKLLERSPDFERRLGTIEERAAKVPLGDAGKVERQALAAEGAALEREMRTASLPGEWKSPLLEPRRPGVAPMDSSEYAKLVERRGSAAPELDHHPPNWTGKDEARFRYGRDIEGDLEGGYRWTLDKNGQLRVDRVDKASPRVQYNPVSDTLEEIGDGEAILRAHVDKANKVTHPLENLPKQTQEEMERLFAERRKLMERRNTLEEAADKAEKAGTKVPTADADELSRTYAQINERSRKLAEGAAESLMRQRGAKPLYLPSASRPGEFDQIWQLGDEIFVIEAKGGGSALGTKLVEGQRVEQGTKQYLEAIIHEMSQHGSDAAKDAAAAIRVALAQGKVKYLLVRAPIGVKDGVQVLRPVETAEFIF